MGLATLLGASMVLRPRFDPEQVLADVARHRARVLVAVPVMLQRILALPDEVRRSYDTSSLQVVASSGSALPAGFATRWMDAFGDNLHSLYGSTEVGWASIATPVDLRADPATAGRPPLGTVVRVLDDAGDPVPDGATGRIFVGNELLFDGYTDGNSKQVIDGLMSTGDVGRLDSHGRLRVDGRDDEMIVSGGENVYPREVEELLERLDGVLEAAVVGVPDDDFGQRLRAVLVVTGDSGPDAEAVRTHVSANLARYKVPRDVVFVDELPRNTTGKVLKRQLAE
jgi:acyl-CoA synthetase (AMP-forming)/AMP-acid ligase II